MYIGDYLARRQLYTPDHVGVLDTGKEPEWRLTYREMNSRANRLGYWLRNKAGITKGDRVAILARDGVEHLDTFFACSKLGAVHSALNWRLHWRETLEIIKNISPKVLIYSDDFKENVKDGHFSLPFIQFQRFQQTKIRPQYGPILSVKLSKEGFIQ